jgi:phosphoribosylaminoimidazole carboxylase
MPPKQNRKLQNDKRQFANVSQRGVPTATVAINNSTNAALLAIRFLGAFMPDLLNKMKKYQLEMETQVKDKATTLRDIDVDAYLAKMGKK